MPILPLNRPLLDDEAEGGIISLDREDPTLIGKAIDRATIEFSLMGRNLSAGAIRSAASMDNTTANVFMLMDRASEILQGHTGIPKIEAFKRVERYYRNEATQLAQMASKMGGTGFWSRGTQLLGSLPLSLGEAGAAAAVAGPVAGFAGLGALSAAERGPKEAGVAALEGAMVGGMFAGTAKVFPWKRGTSIGAAATGLSIVRGEAPEEAALHGATMGILAGAGAPRRPRKIQIKEARAAKKARDAEEPIKVRTEEGKVESVKTDEVPVVEVTERTRADVDEFLGRDYSDLEIPDKAINLNLRRIQGPDDFKRAVAELVDIHRGSINEARRGVITQQQTELMAEDLGMTVPDLLKMRKGIALNAEELTAARKLNRSILGEWKRHADRIRNGAANDAEKAEFLRLTALAEGSIKTTLGATAEAGRALNAAKIIATESPVQMRQAREAIKEFRAGEMKDVDAFADMVSQIDTPQGLAKFAKDARKATAPDKVVELWIMGLLSGPQTHVVNATSNELVSFWTIPETFLAGGIGAMRSGLSRMAGRGPITDRVYLREGFARLFGIAESAREGLVVAGKTFARGEGTGANKLEMRRYRAIEGKIGEVIRVPGRALLAADEFYKTRARRQELNALAVRDGLKRGLSGRELAQHISDYKQNPPESVLGAIEAAAGEQTFTKPLGEIGRAVQHSFSHPSGRVIAPFIRTPTNIFKFSMMRSPFAPVLKEVREDLKAGGARRDTAIARIGFSSAISAWIASEAASGNITGSGPTDTELRRVWYLTHRPYSIRIPAAVASRLERQMGHSIGEKLKQTGDVWISYARLEPVGTILGVSADFAEIAGHLEQEGADGLATKIWVSINRNLTNKTFVQGVANTALAMSDPDRYGPRFVQRLAGTAIPTGIAQVARVTDPTLRDIRTSLEQIKSRIPGYARGIPPRRNVWGEAIFLDGGLGPDLISPFYSDRLEPDKASEEAWRIRAEFPKPIKTIRGIELTRLEYDTLVRETGQLAKRRIDKMVNAAGWDAIPEGLRKEMMQDEYADSRRVIRAKLEAIILRTDPNRFKEVIKKKVDVLVGRPSIVPLSK